MINDSHNITFHKNTSKKSPNTVKENQSHLKSQSQTIEINNDNYHEISTDDITDNSIIIINGTVNNLFLESDKKNVSITGVNDARLVNSLIDVYHNGNIYLSNISFESNDDNEDTISIMLESDNNILENLQFRSYRQEIQDRQYREIEVSGNNNTICNCIFDVTYPALNNNWITYGERYNVAAIAINGNLNRVEENTITIHKSESIQYPFGSNTGICIYGNNNTINQNYISINGTLYMYGITLFYHNNSITNNYIEVHSIRYASGIALNTETSNNTLKNNTIIITTQEESVDICGLVDAAYAIVITEPAYTGGRYRISNSYVTGNIIEENTITGNSSHMYAIEQFGGQKTIIRNNEIDIYGKNPMAVAVIGTDSQIIENNINVHGTTNKSDDSLDYLKPQTTGIYLYQGTNTLISGNNINTDYGTAIRTRNEALTTITDNRLNVENNLVGIDIIHPNSNTIITTDQIDDIEKFIVNGENITFIDRQDDVQQERDPNEDKTLNQTENNNTTTENTSNIEENDTTTSNNNNTVNDNSTIDDDNTSTDFNDTNINTNDTQPNNTTTDDDLNKNMSNTTQMNITQNTTQQQEENNNQTLVENENQTIEDASEEDINQKTNNTLENQTIIPEYQKTNNTINQENQTIQEHNDTEINQTENQTITDIQIINDTANINKTIEEALKDRENTTRTDIKQNEIDIIYDIQEEEENNSIINDNNKTEETIIQTDSNKENTSDTSDENKNITNNQNNMSYNQAITQMNNTNNNTKQFNQTINNTSLKEDIEEEDVNQSTVIMPISNNSTIHVDNRYDSNIINQTSSADNIHEDKKLENSNNSYASDNNGQIDKVVIIDNPDNLQQDNNQLDNQIQDNNDIQEPIIKEIILRKESLDKDNDNHMSKSQILLTDALADSNMKVYELNAKDIGEKVFDDKIYFIVLVLIIFFVSLLYGYVRRSKL